MVCDRADDDPSAAAIDQIPSLRSRLKFQDMLLPHKTPDTSRPSWRSMIGRQGTSENWWPASISAQRPDAKSTRRR
jgi:hypothetical protein